MKPKLSLVNQQSQFPQNDIYEDPYLVPQLMQINCFIGSALAIKTPLKRLAPMVGYPCCGLKVSIPLSTNTNDCFVGIGLAVKYNNPRIFWYYCLTRQKK